MHMFRSCLRSIAPRHVVVAALLVSVLVPLFSPAAVRAATITVDDTVDELHSSGCATTGATPCSLRDAVTFAVGNGADNAVELASGATYALSIKAIDNLYGTTALPQISGGHTLTIDGNGATITRANGAPDMRFFRTDPDITLVLNNLTLTGGTQVGSATTMQSAGAGAIDSLGILTLNGTSVINNTVTSTTSGSQGVGAAGGAIVLNNGTMTATNSFIDHNMVNMQASGYASFPSPPNADGGAIVNDGIGTLTLINTSVSNNTVMMQASGNASIGVYARASAGAIDAYRNPLMLTNCTINGNQVTATSSDGSTVIATGGAIVAGSGGVTLNGTSVTNNSVTVNNPQAIANAAPFAVGGAFSGYNLTLIGSTISNNTAQITSNAGANSSVGPAAISVNGPLTMTSSTVSDNNTTDHDSVGTLASGVRSSGSVHIAGSTISGNRVSGGSVPANSGGLEVSTGTITNSTLSGNSGGKADALFVNNSLTIINSTLAGNATGVGAFVNLMNSATVKLQNTILANTGVNCQNPVRFISLDYNLSSDASCTNLTAAHDQTSINPLLGPLALNAPGTTKTQALLSGSPASDKFPNTGGCNGAGVTSDQRGVARPQPAGGLCDIGAFEVRVTTPSPLPPIQPPGSIAGNPAPLPIQPGPQGPNLGIPAPLPPHRP